MRRVNLPDGGHDKVTSKHSRDLLKKRHDNVTLRRGRTTATLMVVLFETKRRRRKDVLMRRGGYVPSRRLIDVLMRRRWVFHLRHV